MMGSLVHEIKLQYCRVCKYRLWKCNKLYRPEYRISMDYRCWNHGKWETSCGSECRCKLTTISKAQRLSSRHQEILLYFKHQGEKAISCTSNISIWKSCSRGNIPQISALLRCNKVGNYNHFRIFKDICKGNDH